MKYYIIAGEASGDLHGSNLIKALTTIDSEAQIRCWGGDLMEEAGGTLVKHYQEMAFMGFLEVIANLPAIFRNMAYCKKDIEAFQPDVILFIDFSGFNLRIAKWAKAESFRTAYYITPQVWASRESRVEKIRRDIDHLYVILPFEQEFYEQKHQIPVTYVGHPLLDAIEGYQPPLKSDFIEKHGLDPEKPIVALLPGSRKQEVKKILNVMLAVIPDFPEYQFVIGGAPSLSEAFYQEYVARHKVSLVMNATYPLLNYAHSALVTSGTATLETALFKVPQVVCYKGNWISYQIAKRIITLDYISLVNLIMEKEVVRELIQNDLTPAQLKTALNRILIGPDREKMIKEYEVLIQKLGGPGASKRAAEEIYKNIKL